MNEMKNSNLTTILLNLSAEDYCYLTTTGRVTGKPHEIEIWFAIQDITLYLLSGGMDKSDWVKNLLKNPAATIRIANHNLRGTARLVKDMAEQMLARNLLADKYQERETDGSLSDWAQSALVVGIDLSII
jgi:deazaflavin-dependent oxidoreductase (nitroreductase family)